MFITKLPKSLNFWNSLICKDKIVWHLSRVEWAIVIKNYAFQKRFLMAKKDACVTLLSQTYTIQTIVLIWWQLLLSKLGSAHPYPVEPIYWHWVVVKGTAALTVGCCTSSPGQLLLTKSQFPIGFSKAFSKSRWGELSGLFSSCTVPWLVDSEVAGWCHRSYHYDP